jgi:hypothetical protein
VSYVFACSCLDVSGIPTLPPASSVASITQIFAFGARRFGACIACMPGVSYGGLRLITQIRGSEHSLHRPNPALTPIGLARSSPAENLWNHPNRFGTSSSPRMWRSVRGSHPRVAGRFDRYCDEFAVWCGDGDGRYDGPRMGTGFATMAVQIDNRQHVRRDLSTMRASVKPS